MRAEELVAEIDDNSCEAELKWSIGEVHAAEASLKRHNYTAEQKVDAGSHDLHGVVDSLRTAVKEHNKLVAKLHEAADALEAAEKPHLIDGEGIEYWHAYADEERKLLKETCQRLEAVEKRLEGATGAWAQVEGDGEVILPSIDDRPYPSAVPVLIIPRPESDTVKPAPDGEMSHL